MKELDLAYLPIWQDQGDQEYLTTWEIGSRKTLQGLAGHGYVQLTQHVVTVSLGFHANSENIAWRGRMSRVLELLV